MKGEDISERLLSFAVRIIRLAGSLPKSQVARHVGSQLIRCGTSVGSNYEEARGTESRADFLHKLGVSWKEARESWYWLRLVHKAELIKPHLVGKILKEADELVAILGKSLATSRSRSKGEREQKNQENNEE